MEKTSKIPNDSKEAEEVLEADHYWLGESQRTYS